MRTLKENLYLQIEQRVKAAGLDLSHVEVGSVHTFSLHGRGIGESADLLLVHASGCFDVFFGLVFEWHHYEVLVSLLSGRGLVTGTQAGKPKKTVSAVLRTQKAAESIFALVERGLRDVPVLERLASAQGLNEVLDEP